MVARLVVIAPPWLGLPHTGGCGSAPFGGWKTTMSPTLGCVIRRLVRTRWPIVSVGTIDGLGIRYGLTMKAWISSASPTAIATVTTSSIRDLTVDFDDRRAREDMSSSLRGSRSGPVASR